MLRAVRIINFRSIKEVSLTLPRFGAIIGKNGSGKSTLIYVVEIVKHLASGETVDSAIDKVASFPNELFNINSNASSCEIEFVIGSKEEKLYKFNLSLTLNSLFADKNSGTLISIGGERLSLLDEKEHESLIYERTSDGVLFMTEKKNLPFKVSPDRLILSSFGEEEIIRIAKCISSYTILDFPMGYSTQFKVIKGDIPDLTSIDGIAVALYKKDEAVFNEANKVINAIIPEFKPPEIRDLADFFRTEREPTYTQNKKDATSEYLVRWPESTLKKPLSLTAQSGGNMRTIALIYSLFNSPPFSLMLIDEIENGMHMERIAKLIDIIRTQAHNRKIQILFSTHNYEILNFIVPKEVIYVLRSKDGFSEYKVLSETEEYKLVKDDLGDPETTNAKVLFDKGFFN